VVFDAQSHHSPLTLPTLFYEILLGPTSPHFSPHNRPLPGFVKRKTQTFSKNVVVPAVWKCEGNHRHRLYLLLRHCSTASGVLLSSSSTISQRRGTTWQQHAGRSKPCWQLSGKAPIPYLLIRAILFLQSYRSRSASHGMGYPSTRRDRSQLRNQLVRQRRTLNHPVVSCNARFLKRALSIYSVIAYSRRRLMCVHAH
jgi:hypothetical protein